MAGEPAGSIRKHVPPPGDPRIDRMKPHQLLDVIVTVIDGTELRRSFISAEG